MSESDWKVVGRVVGLWRYPVKSMAAESLTRAEVSWQGVEGDRRWAFVRPDATRSAFPWLTIRERPEMGRYVPTLSDPDHPEASAVLVRTPTGEVFDVADPELAGELDPEGARVIRQGRGVFDAFPLSVISRQTIERIGASVGTPLAVDRFRPNILVDSSAGRPFEEDEWVGRDLRIGGMRMRVDKRDGRCVVITVDPRTGEKNPAVLRSVAQERDGCLGVYGSIAQPGPIAVEDPVRLGPPT